jgi:mono/diheme cytochrome c family protein
MLKVMKVIGLGSLCCVVFVLGQAPAHSEEDTLARMKAGKAAFDVECEKCHTRKYADDVTYSRDEWELTMGMMRSNGAQFTDEQRAVMVDFLTAKSLLDSKCSVCHKVDRPLSKAKSRSDWKATVTRMSGKKPGHLTDEEIDVLASYLAAERPAE